MTDEQKKSIPELYIDSKLLIQLLADAEPGQTVTHGMMNQCIGKEGTENVMSETVRNRLLRDHGRVLGSVPGEGYRVLLPDQVANGYATHQRQRAHNICRKATSALATVHRDALSETAQREYDIKCSLLGALTHATSSKAESRVAKQIEVKNASGSDALLATAATLEALKQ